MHCEWNFESLSEGIYNIYYMEYNYIEYHIMESCLDLLDVCTLPNDIHSNVTLFEYNDVTFL